MQPLDFFAFILRMGSSDEVKTKAQEEVEKQQVAICQLGRSPISLCSTFCSAAISN